MQESSRLIALVAALGCLGAVPPVLGYGPDDSPLVALLPAFGLELLIVAAAVAHQRAALSAPLAWSLFWFGLSLVAAFASRTLYQLTAGPTPPGWFALSQAACSPDDDSSATNLLRLLVCPLAIGADVLFVLVRAVLWAAMVGAPLLLATCLVSLGAGIYALSEHRRRARTGQLAAGPRARP
jgi:hypothetical protein